MGVYQRSVHWFRNNEDGPVRIILSTVKVFIPNLFFSGLVYMPLPELMCVGGAGVRLGSWKVKKQYEARPCVHANSLLTRFNMGTPTGNLSYIIDYVRAGLKCRSESGNFLDNQWDFLYRSISAVLLLRSHDSVWLVLRHRSDDIFKNVKYVDKLCVISLTSMVYRSMLITY